MSPTALAISPRSTRLWHWLALAAILVVAGMLRFHELGADCFWHDEIWSLEMSQGRDARQLTLPRSTLLVHPPDLTSLNDAAPAWQIWTHMRLDNHPPLYVLLLRLWRDVFGSSEAAVRAMSVVASLIAIALLFDAVRLLNGPGVALGACLLMAVAVPQVQYAQEARDYAVLSALAMLACAAMVRLEKLGPGVLRAAVLCIAMTAMALTHYFAAGAILALGVYGLIRLRGRAAMYAGGAFVGAIVLGSALWAHEFWFQRGNFAGQMVAWLHETHRHPAVVAAARVALLPARYLFDAEGRVRAPAGVLALLYVVPLLAVRRSPGLLLWCLWLICTVGTVAGLDVVHTTRELAQVRYTLLAAPAVYVMLATAGQWIGRHGSVASVAAGWIVPLAAIAVCVFELPRQAYHPDWRRPDWRGLALAIAERRAPGEIICCVGPGGEDAWLWNSDELYAPLTYYLRPMPAPVALIRDVPPEAAGAADDVPNGPVTPPSLKGYRGLWAIVSGTTHSEVWPPAGWTVEWSTPFYAIGTLEYLRPNPPVK